MNDPTQLAFDGIGVESDRKILFIDAQTCKGVGCASEGEIAAALETPIYFKVHSNEKTFYPESYELG